ncbi:cyclin-dependent kinase inhibitor 7-like isoform X1 [Lycium ferocissimum]|uniref:cyclin-dependent kinase inhibitor 7-like isoform X1 n=1 Tax=Lycium ferocissimum TaxID=112874 RepID=UPI0028166F0A|nr:cyclin-dependent kinase inhibitor 7-like isoform X1 [Lycium ferocissimum]
MGRYIKKCKGIGEVAIMEVSDVDLDVSRATNKRKLFDADMKLSPAIRCFKSYSSLVDTPEDLIFPASSVNSKENYASSKPALSSSSCCSMNRSLDVDENGMEVVASTENRQMKLSSKLQPESGELESTKMPKYESSPPRRMPEKMPSRNEIEEFFARCEKTMFKRFREKYNFDFEKEEPLEGRYEWVQIYEEHET